MPVAEVGGGRSRRSVADVGGRRSVAEVGGVKKVSMCSRNIKNFAGSGGRWRSVAEVGSGGRWRSVAEVAGGRQRRSLEVGSEGRRRRSEIVVRVRFSCVEIEGRSRR